MCVMCCVRVWVGVSGWVRGRERNDTDGVLRGGIGVALLHYSSLDCNVLYFLFNLQLTFMRNSYVYIRGFWGVRMTSYT